MLKKIETEKDEIERQCVITESFKRYCQEIITKGTACDISRMGHSLHARAEELVKTQADCCDMSGIVVILIPFLTATQGVYNFIGEIVLKGLASFYGLVETARSILQKICLYFILLFFL